MTDRWAADFLGLRNLTIMADAVMGIEDNRKIKIKLLDLELTDRRMALPCPRSGPVPVWRRSPSGLSCLLCAFTAFGTEQRRS